MGAQGAHQTYEQFCWPLKFTPFPPFHLPHWLTASSSVDKILWKASTHWHSHTDCISTHIYFKLSHLLDLPSAQITLHFYYFFPVGFNDIYWSLKSKVMYNVFLYIFSFRCFLDCLLHSHDLLWDPYLLPGGWQRWKIMAIEVMIQVAIGQYLGSGGMTLVAQLCPMLKGELKPSYDERRILWKLNPQVWGLPQWQWWVSWTSTTVWSLPGPSSTSLPPIHPCPAFPGPPVVTTPPSRKIRLNVNQGTTEHFWKPHRKPS